MIRLAELSNQCSSSAATNSLMLGQPTMARTAMPPAACCANTMSAANPDRGPYDHHARRADDAAMPAQHRSRPAGRRRPRPRPCSPAPSDRYDRSPSPHRAANCMDSGNAVRLLAARHITARRKGVLPDVGETFLRSRHGEHAAGEGRRAGDRMTGGARAASSRVSRTLTCRGSRRPHRPVPCPALRPGLPP